jgi:ubiquinone/menaquinone biosynthesis C-methylase UbiE
MLEDNNNKNKVYEAYIRHAKNILEDGYRFNPIYIASKALSDWFLLNNVDIKDKRVLNIGCAEPIDEVQFIEKVSGWVALDINEEIIKTAEEIARRKLNPSLFSKLQFVQGNATTMNFPESTFDIVVSFSAIEHIPSAQERQMVFDEISRVLKPNGSAIITVPNKMSTFYFAHKRGERLKTSDYGYAHLYTRGELKKSLLAAGLKPVIFASEYSALITLPSILPRFIPQFLSIFRYFGERIGYLAKKAAKP